MTLKIETTPGSWRIRVRPRINWLILFSALLILLIITGVGLIPAWARLAATIHDGGSIGGPILSLLILSAMAIVNIYAVVSMQNGIRFDCAGETVTFARQATHSDSWDLIDKMAEVYRFPTQEPERSPAVTNW